MTIMSTIEKTIQETIGNTRFNEDTSLEELGIDSIEKAELSVKLQKLLCIKFDFKQFQALESIGQIYQYVLYIQQLSFRQGASEAGKGVYNEYMTEADGTCNAAENSSAKCIFLEQEAFA